MDYKVIFDNASLLFEYFGWYSILLVVGSFILMIPINLLYKKIMAKQSLARLRKIVGSLSVYVVSLGLIALFTGVVIKAPMTAAYLFSATLPCGLFAQLLWATIKVIRDYGISPILKSIAESKEAKAWIANLGLNESLVNTITTSVENYLKDVNAKTFEDVVNQELKINADLKIKLSGFVQDCDMNVAISKILEQVKEKYPKSEKQEVVAENVTPQATQPVAQTNEIKF